MGLAEILYWGGMCCGVTTSVFLFVWSLTSDRRHLRIWRGGSLAMIGLFAASAILDWIAAG